jgi:hypothetical protein
MGSRRPRPIAGTAVLGRAHRTITVAEEASFLEWAAKTWPAPRGRVELDPWSAP